ncbi:MAG: site-2 protease family protein [Thermomicrobiales bacterium]
MEGNMTLGHVWGIPIRINPSLFLILGLLTFSLGSALLPAAYPDMDPTGRWLTALATAVLFAGSILFHELAHAWVALRNGIAVQSVTLYIFGGIAQIESKPKSPGEEFRVAAVGPASSVLLALIFGAINQVVGDRGYLGASADWLMTINLLLAVFNLLPGYPLDGGRILESIVWHFSGKQETGVRVASTSGQLIAYALIIWGVFRVFQGDVLGGIWTAFIGFILHNAATAERQSFLQEQKLAGVSVGKVMGIVKEPEIAADLPLQRLVEQHILGQGQGSFIVIAADGSPVGVLNLRAVSQVPRPDWTMRTAGDVMTPLGTLPRVAPNDDLLAAVHLMDTNQLNQVPVFEHGRLAGLLTRDEVIHHLRLRAETGV